MIQADGYIKKFEHPDCEQESVMKLSRYMHAIFLMVCLLMILIGCSGGSKNPIQPVSDDPSDQTFFSETGNDPQARQQIAVYDAVIDKDAGTFEITPVDREGSFHFPLSQLVPNVLQITGYGFTSTFWADIKLSHPYQGSGIVGFDPRVIAIVPATLNHNMYYPVCNVIANNDIVLEPDGYTKMYDDLGGSITGNTNPFKSYFTSQPYHAWMSSGMTQDTKRWNLYLGAFEGSLNFKLVVDVCTNYPNPPQQVVDNAKEPVQMKMELSDVIGPEPTDITVTATLLDWQGPDDIQCKVEAPDLFTGAVELFYSSDGPNPNEYVFTGTISNDLGAEPGEYGMLLAAWDSNLGNHIFMETTAEVSGFNPVIIKTIGTGTYGGCGMDVSGNYAYAGDSAGHINIIDIDPPESAYIVSSPPSPIIATCLKVSGGYAYSGDSAGDFLSIIDIDPPETAPNGLFRNVEVEFHLVGYNYKSIAVSSGYAYLHCAAVIQIIDIDPPETAYYVGHINSTGFGFLEVCNSGNYLYATEDMVASNIHIINIESPESPVLVKLINTMADGLYGPHGIYVSNGLAYVTFDQNSPADNNGLGIYDIDPPESAHLVKYITTGGSTLRRLFVTDQYAYLTDDNGLIIVDISPLETAHVVDSLDAPGISREVRVSNGYAYLQTAYTGEGGEGFQIIDLW